MCILILANIDSGLYAFRRELIEELVKDNEVYICLPYGEFISKLQKIGCNYLECSFLNRRGKNPIQDVKLMVFYKRIIQQVNPDIVLTYTIKPNVYGGMACARLQVPYAANITGLGSAVENGGLLQKLTLGLYRYGLRKAKKVFFQNTGNRDFMLSHKVVKGAYDLLPGSGVNLEQNCFEEYPENDGTETFLFIGRLMKDKGIEELVRAAERILAKYDKVRFIAVGSCELDYQTELKKLNAERFISMVGEQKNVHEWIKHATAIVHPSYHEGMSNALLESAASGRPVLASNVPGCRETFDEGVSGLGFLPRNVDSLCETIERFIHLPYEVKRDMGRAGRRKMEREFDRQIVINKYIELIRQVRGQQHGAL